MALMIWGVAALSAALVNAGLTYFDRMYRGRRENALRGAAIWLSTGLLGIVRAAVAPADPINVAKGVLLANLVAAVASWFRPAILLDQNGLRVLQGEAGLVKRMTVARIAVVVAVLVWCAFTIV